MTAIIPPLAFWAVDRSAAEGKALTWAQREPRIVTAAVVSCDRARLGESRAEVDEASAVMVTGRLEVAWHVVLEVTFDTDPEQRGLWDE